MLGVIINSTDPVVGTVVSPTDYADLGSAYLLSRRRWEASFTNFEMTFPVQHKAEAELLRNLIKMMRGDTDMWFDGGEFNDMIEFTQVGIGDGATNQFRLPDFNILGPSVIIKINDVIEPLWTLVEAPGVLIFTNAPPDKAIIMAKYKKRSKCRFYYDEQSAIAQTDQFKSFKTEKIMLREVP